jgi:hypothetical protein
MLLRAIRILSQKKVSRRDMGNQGMGIAPVIY